MLKSYLTVAIRNLTKHKFYSVINILGLSIGMAAGFIILQYVNYELSYDSFFENKENIYRVQTDRYNKGELTTQWAAGCAGVGKNMYEDFPEVKKFVSLHSSSLPISYNNEYYELRSSYYAGRDFFTIFSIPLISGVDSLALNDPFTVVLSESLAKRIFRDEDPVGKIIKQNETRDFVVTGVFRDFPANSHMDFDLLYSFETYVALTSEDARTSWMWDGFLNYVVLEDGVDPAELSKKFPAFIEKIAGEELAQYNAGMGFVLQPLEKIHLTSNFREEIKATGNQKTTYFLLLVGMFVLFIAWINYINLTTARSLTRAREVGVRKVLGSYKSQLVGQFMFESLLLNLVALSMAIVIILIAFPVFNEFVGRSSSYSFPTSIEFWLLLIALFGIGVFLSGFYPALMLSNFKPIVVLRGQFRGSSSGNYLRKGLVAFQFLASIVLITGTFVVYEQMEFLRNHDLGVNIDQTLVIETPDYRTDSILNLHNSIFVNGLAQESFVKDITTSYAVPGRTPDWNAGGIRLIEQTEAESNQYRVLGGDDNFIDFYRLEIIAGRKFSREFGSEESNVVFNEAGIKRLGFNDPQEALNRKINFWGDTYTIIGVIKNYRQESPKQAFDALILRYFPTPAGYYSLKVSTSNVHQVINTIQQHWKRAFDNKLFNFFFLDDYYNEQYKTDVQFGSIFGLFAGLAIIIACLGLFGLASYMTHTRTKEMGVRKILGATEQNLWLLLTQDFIKIIGLAILVSLPVSWLIMNNWLAHFANKISINVSMFLIPALALITISILTVSYHVIKTSRIDLAQTLQNE